MKSETFIGIIALIGFFVTWLTVTLVFVARSEVLWNYVVFNLLFFSGAFILLVNNGGEVD